MGGNYKSLLQQLAQRENGTTPTYQLLDEKGPDHSKCFKIAAQIGRSRYQAAWGRNKKEAEQRAARNAPERTGRRAGSVSVGLKADRLRENLFDHAMAFHAGQALIEALEFVGQLLVIEAERARIVACRSFTLTLSTAALWPISSVSP